MHICTIVYLYQTYLINLWQNKKKSKIVMSFPNHKSTPPRIDTITFRSSARIFQKRFFMCKTLQHLNHMSPCHIVSRVIFNDVFWKSFLPTYYITIFPNLYTIAAHKWNLYWVDDHHEKKKSSMLYYNNINHFIIRSLIIYVSVILYNWILMYIFIFL
jgi:hypothetical protein